jgi:hypothetical protein
VLANPDPEPWKNTKNPVEVLTEVACELRICRGRTGRRASIFLGPLRDQQRCFLGIAESRGVQQVVMRTAKLWLFFAPSENSCPATAAARGMVNSPASRSANYLEYSPEN